MLNRGKGGGGREDRKVEEKKIRVRNQKMVYIVASVNSPTIYAVPTQNR